MLETRKIICPNESCRVVLTVRYFDGIENKSLTCPKCHITHKFSEYTPFTSHIESIIKRKQIVESDSDMTDVHNVIHQSADYKKYSSDETLVKDNTEYKIGYLQTNDSLSLVHLKMGKNVIGRRASSSTATVQIEDPSCKMSRSHFIINVVRQEGKGIYHLISLFQGHKNRSFINDVELPEGDEYILHHGDIIRVEDLTIVFKEY